MLQQPQQPQVNESANSAAGHPQQPQVNPSANCGNQLCSAGCGW